MSRAVIFWLGILMVFAGGTIIWFGTKYASRQVGSETVVDQDADLAPKMTSFELIDQTGSRLKSEDLDGEVWAGSIFFASCPSTCYTQNVRLQQLDTEFGERGLKLISVTCDPSNDTPAALAAYASRFNADSDRWHFLTSPDADFEYLKRVGNDFFNIPVAEETHTSQIVVFDRDGENRGTFDILKNEGQLGLKSLVDELLSASADGDPTDDDTSDSNVSTPEPVEGEGAETPPA